jgi:uncharacterized protein DUF11
MSVSDLRDPVRVGAETTFEIRVSNPGDLADRDIRLSVAMPPQLVPSAVGTTGPAAYTIQGQTVQFSPATQIRPGETLTYRVLARAVQLGTGRVTVDLSSANMPQNVTADESTTVVQ